MSNKETSAKRTPQATAGDEFNLDSLYFIAFEMTHNALVKGLVEASDLNINQYRILVKLFQPAKPFSQGKLGSILNLKPNAVTQAVDVLENHGFVAREAGQSDGRTRMLVITQAGIDHIKKVNESIVESLYTGFPTDKPTYRTILEAAIAAAAQIEPPLDSARAQLFPATRSLISINLIREHTARILRKITGASYNECRIVLHLGEAEKPERVGMLADTLLISPVNTARAVNGLVNRGWAKRYKTPLNKKVVYVGLTEEGCRISTVISTTINSHAATELWTNLTPDQRTAIEQVGHVVVADLEAQRLAKEQPNMELLQEL